MEVVERESPHLEMVFFNIFKETLHVAAISLTRVGREAALKEQITAVFAQYNGLFATFE